MFFAILFGFMFLLTPYAEAHRGNPCLEDDYTSSLNGCERGVVDIKPDPYHFDSSRLYDEDEDHRHLPRALGDPRVDYTDTLSEWFGPASSRPNPQTGRLMHGGELVIIPFYDRDYSLKHASEGASDCYVIESGGKLSVTRGGVSRYQRPTGHPFSEEGYQIHEDAAGYDAALVQFERYTGGLDYEKAPFEDETGKYYEYTIIAWDVRDAFPEVTSCWYSGGPVRPSDSSLEISRTFRVYVIDEDDDVNNPPEIDESSLRYMRIFENAAPDTVICCHWPRTSDREDLDGSHHDWGFKLLGPDASSFRVTSGVSDSSRVAVLNGVMFSTRSFDYETKSEYHLTFRVTDSDGGVDEADFTIKIVDLVNESCAPPL